MSIISTKRFTKKSAKAFKRIRFYVDISKIPLFHSLIFLSFQSLFSTHTVFLAVATFIEIRGSCFEHHMAIWDLSQNDNCSTTFIRTSANTKNYINNSSELTFGGFFPQPPKIFSNIECRCRKNIIITNGTY